MYKDKRYSKGIEKVKKSNMEMKKGRKFVTSFKEYFISTLLTLVLGVALGFVSLCLVNMLPVERMNYNAEVAKDMISKEGTTYSIYEMKSTELDNYTDSIMVSTAICPTDASVLEKVVYNYHVSYFKQYSEQENLRRYLEGEEGYSYSFYSHYWNGYLIFLKPLLLLFEYNDILMLNFMVQILLIMWIIIGMVKRKREFLILPFIITLLSVSAPVATAMSIQLSDVIYVVLIGSGLFVWKNGRMEDKRAYLVFLCLGMMTSYLDFLTYPLLSLGIPVIVWLACNPLSDPIQAIVKIVINSAAWSIGYVGMWLSKGIIGSLLYPDSQALETGIGHFFWRTSGDVGAEVVGVARVVEKNVFAYINWPVMFAIAFTVVWLLARIFMQKRLNKDSIWKVLPYFVVMLYPFVWFAIMKNHSYIHAYMVYRILAIAVFAGLVVLANIAHRTEIE